MQLWGLVGLRLASLSISSDEVTDISSKLVDTIRAHVKPDISPPLNDEDEGMPLA